MTSTRAALLILGKDLRQRVRDRSALLVAIVVPLVLASIFGLIFHNAIGGRVTFTFGLVDQDHGAAAVAFRQQVLAPLERNGLITVVSEPTLAAGRHAADSRKVSATFVLPPGFSTAIGNGGQTAVTVIGSVDSSIGSAVAHSIAQSFGDRLDTIRIAAAAAGGTPVDRSQIASAPPPISVADISARSRQLDAGTFYAAGMAVFFVFFTVQFGISSILEERRDGTLARMLVAPVRSSTVLGGKLLTSIVLGTASMAVLALATHLLLGAHWGNPLGVGILIVTGVLAATCVMALVATLARTPDQAGAWQSMVALVLGMLGGTFFPLAQAGGVLAALSLATPQAWFLRGIENLTGGAGPSAVFGPAAAIVAFAVVTGSIAFMRAGRLLAR
ncbi:MAG TPA: ABC transporter permease [Solirubrobacteraceae bacterium]|nr:ABC transporter permease [Solirubrobacteraceae bacterium]